MKHITRAQALREMEIRENPDGSARTFSIQFEKRNGELVFLPRAVAAGLRFNMKENRYRGVVKVDDNLDSVGHIYPVHLDNIHRFNNLTIKI